MIQKWLKISLLLSIFGFFREMRPSEPFVTEFLSGEWRNITSEQINRNVYPIGTYSYLVLLVIVFLVTDILRYKPIIILSGCVGIVIYAMLLWTTSLFALQLVQVLYGIYMAAEIAYFTYMYAKVTRDKYQQVTGNARAALLTGRFLASILGQVLVSSDAMDLRQLNYITMGAQCVSLIWALLLPSVGVSLYFYSIDDSTTNKAEPSIDQQSVGMPTNDSNEIFTVEKKSPSTDGHLESSAAKPNEKIKIRFSCNRATRLLWKHFRMAYSNKTVLQYSLWWALAAGGFTMVQFYVQLLWQQIDPDSENLYNGAVEGALTLLGALSALAAGYINIVKFEKFDLWVLSTIALVQGALVIVLSQTSNIWVAYTMYVVFGVLYMFMITLVSAKVAKHLSDDSFALIFGINTLIAVIFQTILTITVISETGLALDPRGQFFVYGWYFVALALIYCVTALLSCIFRDKNVRNE